jgi:cupin 2 domain-containing protein
MKNIFQSVLNKDKEIFEEIIENKNIKLERIITGINVDHSMNKWYDQDNDEWVLLIQGEAELEFEDQIIQLKVIN